MPIVKKQEGPKATPAKKAPARRQAKPAAPLFALPTERTQPSQRLSDYTWLIYGPKGCGKTSTAARMDANGDGKVLFCMFEPGGKALSIYQTPVITDWAQFKNLVTQLEEDTQGYTTLVVDPGNIAYQRCLDYVSQSYLGGMHPGKLNDYGASWARVNQEFQEIHARIAAIGLTFIVLAHDKDDEVERRNGTKFKKTVPVMSGSTEEFYAGVIDIIAYYHYIDDQRWLMIEGSEDVQSKCRLEQNFKTTKGERIIRIPMGSSPDEAWANIVNAFQNKQDKQYNDDEVM